MDQFYETPNQEVISAKSHSGMLSFAKVFFYMFIGLAITTGVAFATGAIFNAALSSFDYQSETVVYTYYGVMIGSAIALFITMLIIQFVTLRGKHSIIVPALIYATLMGVLLSSFTILLDDWTILGMAFGITAGIFLLMTLIAVFTRGNLSPLLMLGIGLFIGCGILAFVNWFIGSSMVYWLVSFGIFAAVIFISIFDIWNIKKICERGAMTNNLALYCAFTLYVDFVYILIRVVYFLLLLYGRNK